MGVWAQTGSMVMYRSAGRSGQH